METFFYVIGGILVLLALAISFLGMRSDRFPSDAALRAGVLLVALVVAATAYGAVELSQEEAMHREEEQNHEAATEAEQMATSDAESSGTPDTGGGQADLASGDPQAGQAVWEAEGCASCHSLQVTGSTGTIGPNLDTELADRDATFIETSTVDPDAFIEKGFDGGIMPSDYADVLTPEDLANLVAFISDATSDPGAESADDTSSSGGSGSGSGN